ncbi:hypothetical protein BDY24DRAFT_200434 [Mrakia frigida]|uniref:uncharacterized protein n=1 Tax=Mrakia frigida TaxID=29902 RepID=UPI003FCC0DA9
MPATTAPTSRRNVSSTFPSSLSSPLTISRFLDNKENHQGQCHINVTECKDAYGVLRRMVRQSDDLFYCPTCALACGISNFFRPHVSRCTSPAGSGIGKRIRVGGFATPEEACTPRSRTSASPSPRLSPGPSSVPAPSPYARPAKHVVTEEERRQRRKEEEDRLDKKRQVALEFARKQQREREEAKEREKERLRRLERGNVLAAVAAAPLPMFKKRVV